MGKKSSKVDRGECIMYYDGFKILEEELHRLKINRRAEKKNRKQ